jgi:hypothetical protein
MVMKPPFRPIDRNLPVASVSSSPDGVAVFQPALRTHRWGGRGKGGDQHDSNQISIHDALLFGQLA